MATIALLYFLFKYEFHRKKRMRKSYFFFSKILLPKLPLLFIHFYTNYTSQHPYWVSCLIFIFNEILCYFMSCCNILFCLVQTLKKVEHIYLHEYTKFLYGFQLRNIKLFVLLQEFCMFEGGVYYQGRYQLVFVSFNIFVHMRKILLFFNELLL